jgi:hypothetical protein
VVLCRLRYRLATLTVPPAAPSSDTASDNAGNPGDT